MKWQAWLTSTLEVTSLLCPDRRNTTVRYPTNNYQKTPFHLHRHQRTTASNISSVLLSLHLPFSTSRRKLEGFYGTFRLLRLQLLVSCSSTIVRLQNSNRRGHVQRVEGPRTEPRRPPTPREKAFQCFQCVKPPLQIPTIPYLSLSSCNLLFALCFCLLSDPTCCWLLVCVPFAPPRPPTTRYHPLGPPPAVRTPLHSIILGPPDDPERERVLPSYPELMTTTTRISTRPPLL